MAKTVNAPILMIGLIVVTILLIGSTAFLLLREKPKKAVSETTAPPVKASYQETVDPVKMKRAKELYLEAMKLNRSDDAEAKRAKFEEALDYISEFLFELDDKLAPHMNDDGELKKEWSGYNVPMRELQTWQHDLVKSKGLDF